MCPEEIVMMEWKIERDHCRRFYLKIIRNKEKEKIQGKNKEIKFKIQNKK